MMARPLGTGSVLGALLLSLVIPAQGADAPALAQPTQQEADVAPRPPDSPSQVQDAQAWSDDRLTVTLDRLEVGNAPSEEVHKLLTQTRIHKSKWLGRRRAFVILSVQGIRGVLVLPAVAGELRDQRGKKHGHTCFAIRPVQTIDENGHVTEGFRAPFYTPPWVIPPQSDYWQTFFDRTNQIAILTCSVTGGYEPIGLCFDLDERLHGAPRTRRFWSLVPPKARILLIFNVPEGAEPRSLTFTYGYFEGWDGKTAKSTREHWKKIEIELPSGVSP